MDLTREQAVEILNSLLTGDLARNPEDVQGYRRLVPKKRGKGFLKNGPKPEGLGEILLGAQGGNPMSGYSRESLVSGWRAVKLAGRDPVEFVKRHGVKGLMEAGSRGRGGALALDQAKDFRRLPETGVGVPMGSELGLSPGEMVKAKADYVDVPGPKGQAHGYVPDIGASEAYGDDLIKSMNDMFTIPEGANVDPMKRAQMARDAAAFRRDLGASGTMGGENLGMWIMNTTQGARGSVGLGGYSHKGRFDNLLPEALAGLEGGEAMAGGEYLRRSLRPILSLDAVSNPELQALIRQVDPALLDAMKRLPTGELRNRFLYNWVKTNAQNPKHPMAYLLDASFPQDIPEQEFKNWFISGAEPTSPKKTPKMINIGAMSDFDRGTLEELAAANMPKRKRPSEKSDLLARIRKMEEGPEKAGYRKAYTRSAQADRALSAHRKLGTSSNVEGSETLARALLKLTGESAAYDASPEVMGKYGKLFEAIQKNRTEGGAGKLERALKAIKGKAQGELAGVGGEELGKWIPRGRAMRRRAFEAARASEAERSLPKMLEFLERGLRKSKLKKALPALALMAILGGGAALLGRDKESA